MFAPRLALFAFLAAPLIAACTQEARVTSLVISGHAMGTSFEVLIVDPATELLLDDLRISIEQELDRIESIASTYRDSSELSKFNRNRSTDWFTVSGELCSMLRDASNVSHDTHGAFDITVGALVNLWGFGPGDGIDSPPPANEVDAARLAAGYDKLEVDCENSAIRKTTADLEVDLSGWAKGYAVDQVASVLSAVGQKDFLVELGGEIKVKGNNAERQAFAIALESPARNANNEIVIMNARDTGIATSGDYRNFFSHQGTRYSHTIDPRTGRPVQHNLSAVTVVHPSTAYADSIATALLVLGPIDGLALANRLGIDAYFTVSTPEGLDYFASDSFTAGGYLSNQARM